MSRNHSLLGANYFPLPVAKGRIAVKIASCGNDCNECPRYIATQSGDKEQLKEVAVLWRRVGYRDKIVSQEEIEARYKRIDNTQDTPLSADLEERIKTKIREEKQTRALKDWINGLRKNAVVEIDEKILFEN